MLAAALWIACLAPAMLSAQVIKLGTIVPEGSPWHDALLQLDAEWRRLSDGKVQLRIYPGGVAGDESDMLRKIRIGQLHAAALTSVGLISVVPDIEAVSFPLEIQTDAEMEHVLETVGPVWDRQLEDKGFKVLTWSTAGWIRFFAQAPVATADDLRKQKLFFWGSDTQYVELLKRLGYNPIPLAVPDLLPSLQTGLVNAFAAPPTAALAFQWFGLAKNMTDLRWAPLPSVTVISLKQWERIPADLRPGLEAAARDVGRSLRERTRRLDEEAVAAMQEHGLTVIPVTPEAAAQWKAMVREHGYPVFVGQRFSRDIFDRVQSALAEFRARTPHEP